MKRYTPPLWAKHRRWKRSDTMTRREIWKDFFKRTVLTATIALFLFFMFKNVFTKDGQTNYFYVWLCCGIPFGIRRMFVWLVPHGYDIAWVITAGAACPLIFQRPRQGKAGKSAAPPGRLPRL